MKEIEVTIVTRSKLCDWFFPDWVNGFTFGRTIYWRYDIASMSDISKNHESIHVAQYEKHGKIGFLFKYFIRDLFKKYRDKEFEVEAYGHQHNPLYIEEKYGYKMMYKIVLPQ